MYSNLWPNGEWFRKHLNWTVVLWWLAVLLMYWILVIFVAASEELADDVALGFWSAIYLVFAFAGAVSLWYLLVWNLRHKGRSLFNLFYLLIPWIGGIVFLYIKDREQLAEEKMREEKRKKELDDYWEEHGGKPDINFRGGI